jgi:hypothetical protein
VISAGATTSYLDLALHLVDRYAGHPVAVATAKVLAVDKNRLTQRPYFLFADQREHGDSTVLQGAGPDRAAPPRRGGHPAARRALRDERANTEGRHLEWAVEIALLIAANAPLAVQAALASARAAERASRDAAAQTLLDWNRTVLGSPAVMTRLVPWPHQVRKVL